FRDEALDEQAESAVFCLQLPACFEEEPFYKFLLTAVQRQDDTVIPEIFRQGQFICGGKHRLKIRVGDFQKDTVVVGFSGKGGLVDHIAPDKDKAALFQMIDFRPDKIAPLSLKEIINFIVIIVDMYVRHCILKIPDDPADIQAFYGSFKKYILHGSSFKNIPKASSKHPSGIPKVSFGKESQYRMNNYKISNIV